MTNKQPVGPIEPWEPTTMEDITVGAVDRLPRTVDLGVMGEWELTAALPINAYIVTLMRDIFVQGSPCAYSRGNGYIHVYRRVGAERKAA
jgi:hypothetical protein